jgi:hypothetical protein
MLMLVQVHKHQFRLFPSLSLRNLDNPFTDRSRPWKFYESFLCGCLLFGAVRWELACLWSPHLWCSLRRTPSYTVYVPYTPVCPATATSRQPTLYYVCSHCINNWLNHPICSQSSRLFYSSQNASSNTTAWVVTSKKMPQQTPSPVSAYWSAWQILMNFS